MRIFLLFAFLLPLHSPATEVTTLSISQKSALGEHKLIINFLGKRMRLTINSNFMFPEGNDFLLGTFYAPSKPVRSEVKQIYKLQEALSTVPAPAPSEVKVSPFVSQLTLGGFQLAYRSLYRNDLLELMERIFKNAAWQTDRGVRIEYKKDSEHYLFRDAPGLKYVQKMKIEDLKCVEANKKHLCLIPRFGTLYLNKKFISKKIVVDPEEEKKQEKEKALIIRY